MLEFNQNHKVADTSSIRHKLVKIGGTVLLCGVLISSMLLLSGCGAKKEGKPPVATVIITNNDNALLIDISWYKDAPSLDHTIAEVEDMEGDRLVLSTEDSIMVFGENSHERAKQMAESLVGEKGEVICYDEMQNHAKSK